MQIGIVLQKRPIVCIIIKQHMVNLLEEMTLLLSVKMMNNVHQTTTVIILFTETVGQTPKKLIGARYAV